MLGERKLLDVKQKEMVSHWKAGPLREEVKESPEVKEKKQQFGKFEKEIKRQNHMI